MDPDSQYCHPRWLVRLVLLMVLATCVRVWVGPAPMTQAVHAQLADPARQRIDLLQETRRTNELLNEIKQLLETHTFNVRMSGADNQAPPSALPPGGDR